MATIKAGPVFRVVTGKTAHEVIFGDVSAVLDTVEIAYREHAAGRTINPDSYFLRFPNQVSDRIIALPAALVRDGGLAAGGIKWISSYPGNVARGIPRASAVLILNDPRNGYPAACLEASVISAARTAASAVLAALWLNGKRREASRIGVVGAGLIARYIIEFLVQTGWEFDELYVHDRDSGSATAFRDRFEGQSRTRVYIADELSALVRKCDIVVFATTAVSPYFGDLSALIHNPLLLHISLRDLTPEIILASHNVVDDIDHCLKAATSPHLAEQHVGHRRFVGYTLPGILAGADAPKRDRPIVFSPFGMGLLDIAVGQQVLTAATASNKAIVMDDFFFELVRA